MGKSGRHLHLHRFVLTVLILFTAAGGGCRTTARQAPGALDSQWRCDALVADFDHLVRAAGVMDIQAARMDKQPCLRVDRFLLSFRDELTGPEEKLEWIERALRLGASGRHAEISNFPSDWFRKYFRDQKRTEIEAVLNACCQVLAEQAGTDLELLDAIIESAQTAEDFPAPEKTSGFFQSAGRYFVPGRAGTPSGAKRSLPPLGDLSAAGTWYYPDRKRPDFPPDRRAAVLKRARRNSALGIPEPAPEELNRFFEFFAPAFHVSGHIGWPYWAENHIGLDVSDPAVFRYHSFTRMKGRVFLQLNYVLWFPGRGPQTFFAVRNGPLDGLIWRVTLDDAGRVLLYDCVHPSGSHHAYYPVNGRLAVRENPEAGAPPLIPEIRVPDGEHSRVAIHIAGAGHLLNGLTEARHFVPDMIVYRSAPYDRLRSLPRGDGFAGMFGEDALAGGTRAHRFFWPVGTPSSDAPRQRGHQVISPGSRLYFDDPWILEKTFEF